MNSFAYFTKVVKHCIEDNFLTMLDMLVTIYESGCEGTVLFMHSLKLMKIKQTNHGYSLKLLSKARVKFNIEIKMKI